MSFKTKITSPKHHLKLRRNIDGTRALIVFTLHIITEINSLHLSLGEKVATGGKFLFKNREKSREPVSTHRVTIDL